MTFSPFRNTIAILRLDADDSEADDSNVGFSRTAATPCVYASCITPLMNDWKGTMVSIQDMAIKNLYKTHHPWNIHLLVQEANGFFPHPPHGISRISNISVPHVCSPWVHQLSLPELKSRLDHYLVVVVEKKSCENAIIRHNKTSQQSTYIDSYQCAGPFCRYRPCIGQLWHQYPTAHLLPDRFD